MLRFGIYKRLIKRRMKPHLSLRTRPPIQHAAHKVLWRRRVVPREGEPPTGLEPEPVIQLRAAQEDAALHPVQRRYPGDALLDETPADALALMRRRDRYGPESQPGLFGRWCDGDGGKGDVPDDGAWVGIIIDGDEGEGEGRGGAEGGHNVGLAGGGVGKGGFGEGVDLGVVGW